MGNRWDIQREREKGERNVSVEILEHRWRHSLVSTSLEIDVNICMIDDRQTVAHFAIRKRYAFLRPFIVLHTSLGHHNDYELQQIVDNAKETVQAIWELFWWTERLTNYPLLIKHNLLKASKICDYKLLLHVYKHNLLDMAHATSGRYPLCNKQIPTPRTRTNYGRSALTYQIPPLIYRVSSQNNFHIPFHKFKSQIKLFLSNEYKAVTT